ncbi:MAG: penicillin-binding protein 2 [Gemmatimonadetes bacterium]|nr:penicillin-binding protein 2 [Gemmatimonadota bacterium]MBI2614545.1 penicillin-binding protein 2 [Gemmatimonadota bacterium]
MNWFHAHQLARRARLAQGLLWLVGTVLLIAFFRVQVLSSSRYRVRSELNRMRSVPIPAPRGLITDRNGVVLAENEPGYSVGLLAPSVDSLRASIKRIAPLLRLSARDAEDAERAFRRTPYRPAPLRRDASFDLVSALEERRVVMPGLVIQAEPRRRYPFGSLAAHVVGYVAEITEQELGAGTVSGARPGLLVGRDGLEREYDDRLRGKDGERFLEVDALGRSVREAEMGQRLEPEQGESIRTTIDIDLQRYVAESFPEGMRGAVMVMDPATGEMLALYSSPAYDPNTFIGGVDPEVWSRLSQAADFPLLNRAIQARYPPASPWKLVVAAMAMHRGLVDLGSHMPIPCRGGLQYYNRYFRCWKLQGHGDLTLAEAIQYSCDVYFYQLGLKLQLNHLLADASHLGLRDRSGIDLPNEIRPLFPASTEYYNQRYGPRGWTNAVTLNLAIGQGENSQTLANMVAFYTMLANPDGRAPAPHLVVAGDPPTRSLGLSPVQLAGLREALVEVVESGTAVGARVAELRIGGKTGTAQNAHGADHGWFIAFAPADSPRVVVGAVVEFAEHGSRIAPMVNRIIARHLLGPTLPPLTAADYQVVLPDDSAPEPVPILPDTIGRIIRDGSPRPR